jgi:hypothetical protein
MAFAEPRPACFRTTERRHIRNGTIHHSGYGRDEDLFCNVNSSSLIAATRRDGFTDALILRRGES